MEFKGCMQDIAGKHGLTPDWKEAHDSPAKRLQTSKSEINTVLLLVSFKMWKFFKYKKTIEFV